MVAGVAVSEEAHVVREHAPPHGEALLVVAAGDAKDVPFPFIAEGVARLHGTERNWPSLRTRREIGRGNTT